MKKQPRMRADGLCARPDCEQPLPEAAVTDGDPFHTSVCARAYHGVVFASDEKAVRTKRSMTSRARPRAK